MHVYDIKTYQDEIKNFNKELNLDFLKGKTIFIAGACGLVMSYLIDTLLVDVNFNLHIIAMIYSDADTNRFKNNDPRLSFIKSDVRDPSFVNNSYKKIDYIINGASIVDPKGYKERPIDTMTINILGTKNLLDLAALYNASFLLTSSCEIYGEANVPLIKEDYCGRLDPMDVRSCYNESKRVCETMCVSYGSQRNVKTYVARLSRTFGPTQSLKDTKALSQFMMNGLRNENIVLKSKGDQLFSYTYIQDIVSGLLTILDKGEVNNAYNVCNRETLCLKDVATIIADYANTSLIFDLSDDALKGGYSKATLALQDPSKLEALGWKAKWSIKSGIISTMKSLKCLL